MADSSAHIHGKKFALYGDPDLCLGLAGVPARTRRRADPRAVHQRRQALGGEGAGAVRQLAVRQELPRLSGQGSLAHALAAVHRAGRFPDRQHLRQVSGARHRHAADPHRLPDLRPPSPPSLSGLGLPGRHERAGVDPRQDLRRDRHATPTSRRRPTTASTSSAEGDATAASPPLLDIADRRRGRSPKADLAFGASGSRSVDRRDE